MIETFEFCDRNSSLHYGCKDNLIKDARMVWQTKDIIIICGGLMSTAYIKWIGKTVTLAQAVFPLLIDTRSLLSWTRYITWFLRD